MNSLAVCPLDDLGLLRFRGPDTRAFLQGQLSNDVTRVHAGVLLRAGVHNPQGRTLALLLLSAGDSEQELSALLPRELIAMVAANLNRYVLRSKVKISDESADHRIYGISGLALEGERSHEPRPGLVQGYASGRGLLIVRASEPPPLGAPLTRAHWRALDIAAGLPQVYAATAGQFVAQMLNLDCIDAISFNKGCYTGQEVIARAHFRGRVKRRMQRFRSEQPLQLAPGASGELQDGRSFRVVEAVEIADRRCEFLAVAPLPGESGAEGAAPADAAASARIAAQALSLPYLLPG